MHDSANTQRCSIDRSVQGEFWAVVSQTGLLRKPHPTTQANSGPQFPDGASWENCIPLRNAKTGWAFRLRHLAESPSQNRRPKRATISQTGLQRKLRPGIGTQTETYFPDRAPRGNCGPESAPETGRGFPEDRISRPPLVKIIRFPLSHAEHPKSVPECRHNRNVPSCRQHFAATAKTRAGNRSHLRGFSGRSQRYVTEAHVSYGLPNGTGTRCLSRRTKR